MEDFNDISPDLKGVKKDNPFRVPDNYFESFPEKIKSRIAEMPVKKTSEKTLVRKMMPVFYAAAAVVLLIIGVTVVLNFNSNNSVQSGKLLTIKVANPQPINIEIATAEIVEEFDESIIIDFYTYEQTVASDSVTQDELYDYIADNIDINTIIDNY
ncbi:MAG: hypothetical protein A2W91_18020 [Bacteroidetes bacterium GWF2_38_335]|nr:MAG: hypothetical protein A2W91_18020 [Bacteroidetes bacterium GWF2_38_335]HBS88537.1 hypothetical protein [Bacteroidales bacterium]